MMRVLSGLVLSLALLVPTHSWAAWSQVQVPSDTYDGSSSSTIAQAYGSNVTAASLLVCTFTIFNSDGTKTFTGVADSRSQTWTQIGSTITFASVAGSWSISVWYFLNTTAGANTVTATVSAATIERGASCSEYSGIATSSALDQTTGQSQIDPGTGTDAVTSGTTSSTTASNELVYAGMMLTEVSLNPSVGTGFTARGSKDGSFYYLRTEDKNLAAAGTTAGTFTSSGITSDSGVIVATFKEPTTVAPFFARRRAQ